MTAAAEQRPNEALSCTSVALGEHHQLIAVDHVPRMIITKLGTQLITGAARHRADVSTGEMAEPTRI